jgi:hypothetical protein
MAVQPWAPSLGDVARHIPTRTRDTLTPGSDRMLGTFTESTTPTSEQAQQTIDDVVTAIAARIGTLPATLPPGVLVQARLAAEWRAAADIEVAYPVRDADVRVYDQLNLRAMQAMADLLAGLGIAGAGEVAEYPAWSAPNPPVYADRDPGDYARPASLFWTGGP